MGGDRAPEAVVEGVLRAAQVPGREILLVGPEQRLRALVNRGSAHAAAVRIVDAQEVIGMADQPVRAVLRKKNASLVVCGDLVRSGEADAFISAGNSGATMAVANLKLRCKAGIDRPAIASILPSRSGRVVLLDAGANVDSTALNLQQFGIMGSVYAAEVFGIRDPRVGLLNIGEEDCKGNELARDAFPLLKEAPIRFIGNVEGRDIFLGGVDVVVCDGFAGNVVLKVSEGVAEFFLDLVKEEMKAHPLLKIPALMLRGALRRIARKTNYEEVGGAQLLGVNGVCIISHGRSNARAITNAIHAAAEAVEHGVVDKIGRQVVGARGSAALV
jgi:glycerol-3-phosphate acyltransferase PlsX